MTGWYKVKTWKKMEKKYGCASEVALVKGRMDVERVIHRKGQSFTAAMEDDIPEHRYIYVEDGFWARWCIEPWMVKKKAVLPWISVDDMLPKTGSSVLVWNGNGRLTVNAWYKLDNITKDYVKQNYTHWMYVVPPTEGGSR
jgi:hypothetical protein